MKKRLFAGTEYTFVLHVEQNNIRECFHKVLSNNALIPQAKEVGLVKDSKDNRVFYKNIISTGKPMSDMTHEELKSFLRKAYKDINNIQASVSQYIPNK